MGFSEVSRPKNQLRHVGAVGKLCSSCARRGQAHNSAHGAAAENALAAALVAANGASRSLVQGGPASYRHGGGPEHRCVFVLPF